MRCAAGIATPLPQATSSTIARFQLKAIDRAPTNQIPKRQRRIIKESAAAL
jgi:hypothetical protein